MISFCFPFKFLKFLVFSNSWNFNKLLEVIFPACAAIHFPTESLILGWPKAADRLHALRDLTPSWRPKKKLGRTWELQLGGLPVGWGDFLQMAGDFGDLLREFSSKMLNSTISTWAGGRATCDENSENDFSKAPQKNLAVEDTGSFRASGTCINAANSAAVLSFLL